MIQAHLRDLLEQAIATIQGDGLLPLDIETEIELERSARPAFGDFSCNIALGLSAIAKAPPREVAAKLLERLPPSNYVIKTEIAGPGFINFFLSDEWLHETIREITEKKEGFGRCNIGKEIPLQIEFVSANPTGPLHIGSGRNAAYGDALANLLAAAGYRVSREFLVNDYGKQVMQFAHSLEARYRQALGHDAEVPADGYRGDYLIEMGKELAASEGMGLIGRLPEIRHWGITHVLASHRSTLEKFGVTFDNWFSESHLHATGKVDAAIARLTALGYTYESEGAIWFKASESGASRDQVLIRSGDPTPTYLAADVAYMLDKLERGFERILYVWGADHHGNSETLMAAARVLGIEDRVEIIIYQLVNFLSKGEPVRMSKRTGDLVAMDELMDEVGVDAARYTLLTRSTDSTIDFDLETVKAESQDNPVYYVQYQYARISSILRYADERAITLKPAKDVDLGRLTHPSETALIQKLSEYPEVIESSAKLRAPFRITNYMQSLGAAFSAFYRDCRAITDDPELTQARLALASAAHQVLANAFAILGVSAPERM